MLDPRLSNNESTDESLAKRVQDGNSEAFSELVHRYDAKLKRYGRSFLYNPADIEDLVQDAFIKAYENIRSFDVHQRFSPWMYRIAHNTFVNRLRRNAASPVSFVDLDLVLPHATAPETESREDARRMRLLVEQGLERIDAKYREVLVLHYFEELSYKEIASVLRVPIGTVGIRLARARIALKKYLPEGSALL